MTVKIFQIVPEKYATQSIKKKVFIVKHKILHSKSNTKLIYLNTVIYRKSS